MSSFGNRQKSPQFGNSSSTDAEASKVVILRNIKKNWIEFDESFAISSKRIYGDLASFVIEKKVPLPEFNVRVELLKIQKKLELSMLEESQEEFEIKEFGGGRSKSSNSVTKSSNKFDVLVDADEQEVQSVQVVHSKQQTKKEKEKSKKGKKGEKQQTSDEIESVQVATPSRSAASRSSTFRQQKDIDSEAKSLIMDLAKEEVKDKLRQHSDMQKNLPKLMGYLMECVSKDSIESLKLKHEADFNAAFQSNDVATMYLLLESTHRVMPGKKNVQKGLEKRLFNQLEQQEDEKLESYFVRYKLAYQKLLYLDQVFEEDELVDQFLLSIQHPPLIVKYIRENLWTDEGRPDSLNDAIEKLTKQYDTMESFERGRKKNGNNNHNKNNNNRQGQANEDVVGNVASTGDKVKKECYAFRDHGSCKYGDKCRYKHVKAAKPAASTSTAETKKKMHCRHCKSRGREEKVYSTHDDNECKNKKRDIAADKKKDGKTSEVGKIAMDESDEERESQIFTCFVLSVVMKLDCSVLDVIWISMIIMLLCWILELLQISSKIAICSPTLERFVLLWSKVSKEKSSFVLSTWES